MTDNTPPPEAGNGNAPPKPPDEPAAPDLSHTWIGAAMVPLDERTAKRADRYQSYRATEGDKIKVLDIFCEKCRMTYGDERDTGECAAKVNNEHLIGGNQAVRKKRKVPKLPDNAIPMPPPRRVSRRGIDAVIDRTT